MFSIGEFASIGRVSVRMLRHYDEIGLLTPARVDPFTGYRSYEGSLSNGTRFPVDSISTPLACAASMHVCPTPKGFR